jgi:membrane protein implicated in regulation of membrane protease activity
VLELEAIMLKFLFVWMNAYNYSCFSIFIFGINVKLVFVVDLNYKLLYVVLKWIQRSLRYAKKKKKKTI